MARQESDHTMTAWRIDDLFRIFRDELREKAHSKRRRVNDSETVRTTALVNDTYLHLRRAYETLPRAEFLKIAARTMQRIVLDYSRHKSYDRRSHQPVESVDESLVDQLVSRFRSIKIDLIALSGALDDLEVENQRASEVVRLRYFTGVTMEEVATALDIGKRTAERYHQFAMNWLAKRIGR